jgi:hypothetical protein
VDTGSRKENASKKNLGALGFERPLLEIGKTEIGKGNRQELCKTHWAPSFQA